MSFEITAHTALFGLLGHPVGHSVSPFIHNSLSEHFGHDLRYLAYDVEVAALKAAVEGAYALKIKGLNVTVPHKQAVREFLLSEDEAAARIGAVNTLKRVDGGWQGYNTDMPGFIRALESDGISVKGRHVCVLGAGGAARAIICALLKCGAAKLVIYNRTCEKAQALAEEFAPLYPECDMEAAHSYDDLLKSMRGTGEKWLAVNTTSVGMYPNVDDILIKDEAFYKLCYRGVDIIFNPAKTAFMKAIEAADKDNKAYNGLKMLLFQGIRSYEIWNDVSISDEVAMQIYPGLAKRVMG